MKKILASLFFLLVTLSSFSQSEGGEKNHKFRQDNIFLGGSIGLGFGGGGFSIGANPEIGYTLTNWLDVGISTNVNYSSNKVQIFSNQGQLISYYSEKSFNYGGGVFARVYPIKDFFIQLLPEYNIINTTLKDINIGSTGEEIKISQKAPSFLAGIGYGSRIIGSGSFFTVLMIDLGNNTNSPYIDFYGSKLPILRTGFNFYLKPKRK